MDTFVGIGWTFLAAFFLGTFALPSKYVKNYAWENTWGAFFFIGMLVVPVGFSALVVKGLWATYAQVPPMTIFGVMALGFMWGEDFVVGEMGLQWWGSLLVIHLQWELWLWLVRYCRSFLAMPTRQLLQGG